MLAWNNTTEMFQHICETVGKPVIIGDKAVPNMILETHLNDQETIDEINACNWDYIILQATQGDPKGLMDPFWVIEKLYDTIKANNPCTQVLLFMPWTIFGEDLTLPSIIEDTEKYALQLNLAIVPAGKIWQTAKEDYPDMNLYADMGHPNVMGSYVSACAMYNALFAESLDNVEWYASIDTTLALYFQELANRTITQHHGQWNIGYHARFDFSIQNARLTTRNVTPFAVMYFWDFGDGTTCYEACPVHYYKTEGTYNVVLSITSDSCMNNNASILKTVMVENADVRPLISPNPANDRIFVDLFREFENISVTVYDATGKIITTMNRENCDSFNLNVGRWRSGVYLVEINTDGLHTIEKVVKKCY